MPKIIHTEEIVTSLGLGKHQEDEIAIGFLAMNCTGLSTLCHCGSSSPSKAAFTKPMSPQIFHHPKLAV